MFNSKMNTFRGWKEAQCEYFNQDSLLYFSRRIIEAVKSHETTSTIAKIVKGCQAEAKVKWTRSQFKVACKQYVTMLAFRKKGAILQDTFALIIKRKSGTQTTASPK